MNKPALSITAALLATAVLPATVSGAYLPTNDESKSDRIVVEGAFMTPESVEYHADEDVYLVSNINGGPFAADGNGFISKVSPDGDITALKWIDGAEEGVTLNAPKGMAVSGEQLYVTDIDTVRVFALPEGKQTASIMIEGSTFLNGITPADGECVYVTDSGFNKGFEASETDAVYKVCADGEYTQIAADKNMGRPNGIVRDGSRLVVVTFGSGEVFSLEEGEQSAMPAPPKGSLDGVLRLEDGRLVISSWAGSAVYASKDDGTYEVLADELDAPADMGLDTKRNRVLVPLFKQNKVVILPLK